MFWKKKTPKENQKKQTSRATPISNRSEIPVNFANLTVDSVASVIHQSEQGVSIHAPARGATSLSSI